MSDWWDNEYLRYLSTLCQYLSILCEICRCFLFANTDLFFYFDNLRAVSWYLFYTRVVIIYENDRQKCEGRKKKYLIMKVLVLLMMILLMTLLMTFLINYRARNINIGSTSTSVWWRVILVFDEVCFWLFCFYFRRCDNIRVCRNSAMLIVYHEMNNRQIWFSLRDIDGELLIIRHREIYRNIRA